MLPHPLHWATPRPHCQATSRLCHQATTHLDLWHLLDQKLTWTIIVSFRLHLNQQKMARATQVKLNLPIIFILLQLGYGFDVRKYLQYPTSRTVCRKNVGWKYVKNDTLHTRRMHGESAQILSNRLATLSWFRGELWWSDFLPTAQLVLPELCLIFLVLQ